MVSSIENKGHAGFVHAASLPMQQFDTFVDIGLLRLTLRNHEQNMRGMMGQGNRFTTGEN
jgi:hypothetical protein